MAGFLLFSFDYQQAQVSGLHTRCLHYGLLCMVSLTIVATLKAVGIILSISLLIAPGAIAVLLTQRFHIALLLAIGISVIVSMTGVWLSFFIDSAPAPTIVVLFAVVFIMTFTVTSINARTKETPIHRICHHPISTTSKDSIVRWPTEVRKVMEGRCWEEVQILSCKNT